MNEFALEIHDLAYSFDDRLLFSGLNFKIHSEKTTVIVGSNNSGKTTLAKILGGVCFTEDKIHFGKFVLDAKTIGMYKKKVSYVDFSNMKFYLGNVYDEIYSQMDFTKWSIEKKDKQMNKVLYDLDLMSHKDKNISRLSKKNKILLKLAKALVLSPKVLVLELSDIELNKADKDFIFEILEDYKEDGLTIVFATNNSEDILYADRMIVLHKGSIAIEGATNTVLKKDSLLLKLGIELPFMVDLSLKLKFYEVVSKVYLDKKELVDKLWK